MMYTQPYTAISAIRQRGMTLIELTVVLLILVTLATVALRSTSGLQEQARWEQTKNRYQALRAAIVGDPKLTLNGQPDISGFVADIGRLPQNIKELLSRDYCDNDYTVTTLAACTGGTWKTRDDYFLGCSDGVSATAALCAAAGESWHELPQGWKGPYLQTNQPSTEAFAFADGWGNEATANTDLNYGWSFTPDADPATTINFFSIGCPSCSSPYNQPYPLAVTNPGLAPDDWTISLVSGLSVTLQTQFNGCDIDDYTYAGPCELAGGNWSGKCTEVAISENRLICAITGGFWAHNGCSDGVSDQVDCATSITNTPPSGSDHVWATPCVGDDSIQNKIDCESAGMLWIPCENVPASFNSKALCDNITGPGNYPVVNVHMKITYRDGNGGTVEIIATRPVVEDGAVQTMVFDNFTDSIGNAVTRIPMGINRITINKSNNDGNPFDDDDIYPAACTNLTESACTTAGGTFLNNGLCGDITPDECTSAGGTMTKSNQQIAFIPHKNLPVINW